MGKYKVFGLEEKKVLNDGFCCYCMNYLRDGEVVETHEEGYSLSVKVETNCPTCGKKFSYWKDYQMLSMYNWEEG